MACVWAAASAHAQSVQYTPPGGLVAPQTPSSKLVLTAADEARWRLGVIRLSPWFGIRNFGFNSNVFGTAGETKRDFTCTVGAGLRGYVRMGPKTVIVLHALPEYVWWAELSDRRTLNGRYGAALFGYYNHLTIEAEATTAKQQTYVSSEVEQPVDTRLDHWGAVAEFLIANHFGVFGSATRERWRLSGAESLGSQGEQIALLGRTEDVGRAGLRYYFQSGWRLGVGLERSEADFSLPTSNRSNRGLAPMVEVRLDRTRLDLDATLVRRAVDPVANSDFVPYRGVNGRFRAGWLPGRRVEFVLNGRRDWIYSTYQAAEAPYYVSERLGGGVIVLMGRRLRAQGFVESGSDRFVPFDPESVRRLDKVLAFGGGVGVDVGKGMQLQIGVSRMRYDSNVRGQDRSFLRIQTSVVKSRGDSPWF